MTFDLAIIGGGPAGYKAAELAGQAGLRTVLFEGRSLGGVCLNEGCIPTKAFLNSAKIYTAAREGARFGVVAGAIELDHAAVLAHKNRVVKALVSGVEGKCKRAGVQVVREYAKLAGRGAEGFAIQAGEQTYSAQRVLLCAGSVPVVPPIPGLAQALASGFALTSREILDLDTIPKRLTVVGGGVIGVEMANYFAEAGSQVQVVEMLNQIGGPIDPKLAAHLQKQLEKAGVTFNLGCKVTAFEDNAVVFQSAAGTQRLESEHVLLSIGRRANTADLGLDTVGVAMERGAVVTDDKGRTSIGGIWAAGDINGKSLLAHTAYREAEVCIANILGQADTMSYEAIPAVIYTHPEVASVGLSAEQAKAKGYDVRQIELPLRYSGRYLAENPSGSDFCSLVIEAQTRRVLGFHMSGNYASEIIYGAALMIEKRVRLEDIKKTVFPHPSVSEVMREAAFELKL